MNTNDDVTTTYPGLSTDASRIVAILHPVLDSWAKMPNGIELAEQFVSGFDELVHGGSNAPPVSLTKTGANQIAVLTGARAAQNAYGGSART